MAKTRIGRDTCPRCGSEEITHVVFGFPPNPESLPEWVRLGGCVIWGGEKDRECGACGDEWQSARRG